MHVCTSCCCAVSLAVDNLNLFSCFLCFLFFCRSPLLSGCFCFPPAASAVSLTVGKLKLMLERLLRVKAGEQALLLVPPPDSGAQVRTGGGKVAQPARSTRANVHAT